MKKILLALLLLQAIKATAQPAVMKQRIQDSIITKSKEPRGVTGTNLGTRLKEMVDQYSDPTNIQQSTGYQFVTADDKTNWNGKVNITDSLTSYATPAYAQALKDAAIAIANANTANVFASVTSASYQGVANASTNPGSHVANRLWITATGSTPTNYPNFGFTLPANMGYFISDNGTTYDTLRWNVGLANYYAKAAPDGMWLDSAVKMSYLQNGRVVSNGTFSASGSYRALRMIPIPSYADSIYIVGFRDPSNSRAIQFYGATEANVIAPQVNTSTTGATILKIPTGAKNVSINIVSVVGWNNSADTLTVGWSRNNYRVSVNSNAIVATGLSKNNFIPDPDSLYNAVNLRYANANYMRDSNVFVHRYWAHDSTILYPNYYVGASGGLVYEEGALSVRVPAFTNQAIYMQYWNKLNSNADTAFFTSASYLNGSGTALGNTGFLTGSTNPRIFSSSNANWRYVLLTLWRPTMANYFTIDSFILRNDVTDSIWIAGGNTGIYYKGKKYNTTRNNLRDFGTVKPIVKPIYVADSANQRNDAVTIKRMLQNNKKVAFYTQFGNDGGDHDSALIAQSVYNDDLGKWQYLGNVPIYAHDTMPDIDAESNGYWTVLHDSTALLYTCIQRWATYGMSRAVLVRRCFANPNGIGFNCPNDSAKFLTPFDRHAPSQGSPVYIKNSKGEETDSLLVCIYKVISGTSSTNAIGYSEIWLTADGGKTHQLIADTIWNQYGIDPPTINNSTFEHFVYQIGYSDSFVVGYRTNTGGCRAQIFTNHFQTRSPSFELMNGGNSTSTAVATNYLTANGKRLYIGASNRVYRRSSDHTYERKYLALSLSTDGINYQKSPIYISIWDGVFGGFEPSLFVDYLTDKLHVAWSTYRTPPWATAYESVFDMNEIIGQLK